MCIQYNLYSEPRQNNRNLVHGQLAIMGINKQEVKRGYSCTISFRKHGPSSDFSHFYLLNHSFFTVKTRTDRRLSGRCFKVHLAYSSSRLLTTTHSFAQAFRPNLFHVYKEMCTDWRQNSYVPKCSIYHDYSQAFWNEEVQNATCTNYDQPRFISIRSTSWTDTGGTYAIKYTTWSRKMILIILAVLRPGSSCNIRADLYTASIINKIPFIKGIHLINMSV